MDVYIAPETQRNSIYTRLQNCKGEKKLLEILVIEPFCQNEGTYEGRGFPSAWHDNVTDSPRLK